MPPGSLNHLKWQKATSTASYEHCRPGSQELGKEVNREHQQHKECRPLWEGKNNTTKVPHSLLKAQPSFPPLESATPSLSSSTRNLILKGTASFMHFQKTRLGQHVVSPLSERITTFPLVPCLPQTQAVTCKSGWLLT